MEDFGIRGGRVSAAPKSLTVPEQLQLLFSEVEALRNRTGALVATLLGDKPSSTGEAKATQPPGVLHGIRYNAQNALFGLRSINEDLLTIERELI